MTANGDADAARYGARRRAPHHTNVPARKTAYVVLGVFIQEPEDAT